MSNAIVKTLDQVAERLSKSLGKDASKAVEDLYRDTDGKLKQAIGRSVKADKSIERKVRKIGSTMVTNAEDTGKSMAEKAETQSALRARLERVLDPKYPYRRPSGYRKGVRDKVWSAAKKQDGKVYDPLTKEEIKPGDKWDMGHRPGYEFRKHRDDAYKRGISRKQFLNEHNTPSHYWPELPESNQCHDGEDHSDFFGGP